MTVYARFTITIQRHLEGSILLKWVIWHVMFFFACRAQNYTFCLLIVQYMLSDKIKGKSALKTQTFLLERDKVRLGCHIKKCMQAQIHVFLKPFICEMFTYIKEAFDPWEFFSNGH